MNGSASCWGRDDRGQQGNGESADPFGRAVSVLGVADAVSISAGDNHTCILKRSGQVACFGAGVDGQRGNALPTLKVAAPVIGFPLAASE
jgi:alpha-tubulin suppressor-like RCC1 family protein